MLVLTPCNFPVISTMLSVSKKGVRYKLKLENTCSDNFMLITLYGDINTMIACYRRKFVALILFSVFHFSIPKVIADSVDSAEATALQIISQLEKKAGVNKDALSQAVKFINDIVRSSRQDQFSVYQFANQIDTYFLTADDWIRKDVNEITSKLIEESYGDELFQNRNLSDQIKTRLTLLTARALLASQPGNKKEGELFLKELKVFSNRYHNSRRFLIGFGVGYSYLPQITYSGASHFDFTKFDSSPTGNGNRISVRNEFSSASYPALVLIGRTEPISVHLSFPSYRESQEMNLPVRTEVLGDGQRLFYGHNIRSELKAEFDAAFKLNVNYFLEKFISLSDEKKPPIEYVMELGYIGFRVKDSISTELRMPLDDTQSFSDLTTLETITTYNKKSFVASYVGFGVDFRLSDEMSLGFTTRYVRGASEDESSLDVSGKVVQFNMVYYPTFPFL